MEEERKVNECKGLFFNCLVKREEIEIEDYSKLEDLELSDNYMKELVDEYGKKKIRFEEQSEFANRLELKRW